MLLPLLCVSCIDEDLSGCGADYNVVYNVQLVTNITTEVRTELTTVAEVELGKRLQSALANVFSDHAHDIDLSFFESDSTLSYNESHVMNNNTASFTIYLPKKEYMHLSVANKDLEESVYVENGGMAQHMKLRQVDADEIESHCTGLFTARAAMHIADEDQTFDVHLYMQNCAAAIVLEPNGNEVKSVKAYMRGLANSFAVRDSVYTYDIDTKIKALTLDDTGSDLLCLYGVGFPSRDTAQQTKSLTDLGDEDAIWQYDVYVTMPDDKVTLTTLNIKAPLKAADLMIIKTVVNADGSLSPNDPEVGASVELDWKPGGVYEPEV
jgi:hypothetical protein